MLEQQEANLKRVGFRRRRNGLDSERESAVRQELDALLSAVTAGSELLYDGLPASSLDGQPLAVAIEAHLRHPAIPMAEELLRGLCTAAGLCLVWVECTPRAKIADLREHAAEVQAAVERSQCYWRAMLEEVPEGCRRPLPSSCRWRRRARCRHHSGRHRHLGEPPW